MSVDVNVNGVSFAYPTLNDSNWGDVASSWAVQVSNTTLQLNAGDFSITNELNLGPNFGLKALQLETRSSNPALAGFLRLSNSDLISWRNNANDANLSLSISASDRLSFEGAEFVTAGSTDALTNKTIDADLNTLSNIRTSNFASGVIQTDFSNPGDAVIPTVQAVSNAIVAERDAIGTLANKTLTSPVINGGSIQGTQITNDTAQVIALTAGDFTLPADLSSNVRFTADGFVDSNLIFTSLPDDYEGTWIFTQLQIAPFTSVHVLKDIREADFFSTGEIDFTFSVDIGDPVVIQVSNRNHANVQVPSTQRTVEQVPTTVLTNGAASTTEDFTWVCPGDVNLINLTLIGAGASGAEGAGADGGGAGGVVHRTVKVAAGSTYAISIGIGASSITSLHRDGETSTFETSQSSFDNPLDGLENNRFRAEGGTGTTAGRGTYLSNSITVPLEVTATDAATITGGSNIIADGIAGNTDGGGGGGAGFLNGERFAGADLLLGGKGGNGGIRLVYDTKDLTTTSINPV